MQQRHLPRLTPAARQRWSYQLNHQPERRKLRRRPSQSILSQRTPHRSPPPASRQHDGAQDRAETPRGGRAPGRQDRLSDLIESPLRAGSRLVRPRRPRSAVGWVTSVGEPEVPVPLLLAMTTWPGPAAGASPSSATWPGAAPPRRARPCSSATVSHHERRLPALDFSSLRPVSTRRTPQPRRLRYPVVS